MGEEMAPQPEEPISLLIRIREFQDEIRENWGKPPEKIVLHPSAYNQLKDEPQLSITLEPFPSPYCAFLGMNLHVVDYMPEDRILFLGDQGKSEFKTFVVKNIAQKPRQETLPKNSISKPKRMIQI